MPGVTLNQFVLLFLVQLTAVVPELDHLLVLRDGDRLMHSIVPMFSLVWATDSVEVPCQSHDNHIIQGSQLFPVSLLLGNELP